MQRSRFKVCIYGVAWAVSPLRGCFFSFVLYLSMYPLSGLVLENLMPNIIVIRSSARSVSNPACTESISTGMECVSMVYFVMVISKPKLLSIFCLFACLLQ